MDIPQFDLGGSGAPLHFLHANGYPPECYRPLLDLFHQEYHVFGMLLRPLWEGSNPEDLDDWHPLADDLLRFLEARGNGKVIGVGHSVGGVTTLRAALLQPEKFRALILLDPVLFLPTFLLGWSMIRLLGLGEKVHPLIAGAKKRRRTFDDLDSVFRGYRSRSIFRFMSGDYLRQYIKGITSPRPEGGYELVYSPEWEARIYLTGLRDFDLWRGLPHLKVPTLIIRGAETDTFLERNARLVQKKNPAIKIVTLERATHIVPLELPREVFEITQSFLKENL